MPVVRNVVCTMAVAALGLSALAQPGVAQTYPSRNVTVVVAFPAGGLADIIGRLVASKLDTRMKGSFVVENRGGAGGNIAARAVAGAAPDGYTLLVTTSGLAANPASRHARWPSQRSAVAPSKRSLAYSAAQPSSPAGPRAM